MPAADPRPPVSPPRVPDGTGWLLISTVAVAAVNYGYALILVWALSPRDYTAAVTAASLLLICGTVSNASLPWILAREVADPSVTADRRRGAVAFCLVGTVGQGVIAAGLTCLVSLRYADGPMLWALATATMLIFASSIGTGYLQGQGRFRRLASLRLAEVMVKVIVGVLLVTAGLAAVGATIAFAAGAAVVLFVGVEAMFGDLRSLSRPRLDRTLARRAVGVFGIQAGVAVLAGFDIVIAGALARDPTDTATYQVSVLAGRIPMFVTGALSTAVFVGVALAAGHLQEGRVRGSLRTLVVVTVPGAIAVATLPNALLNLVLPGTYHGVQRLLPWTVAAGLALGTVNLTTTFFQASGRFGRPTRLLAACVAVGAVTLAVALREFGAYGLAVAEVAVTMTAAGLMLRLVAKAWPGSLATLVPTTVGMLLLGSPLLLLHGHPIAWMCAAGPIVLTPAYLALRQEQPAGEPTGRPKVLHLAFEDPLRPGAGGGSVRTMEMNRRLAEKFDLTVVYAAFPGCVDGVEDGIRYVHVGLRNGAKLSLLSYFACLPLALRRYPSDLVVEDFAAPFASVAVPWMTRRPTIGMVQWLSADQKSQQYHLPFHWIQWLGLRAHTDVIAVSDDLADELRARNPRLHVTTIKNGLPDEAFALREPHPRQDIAYLGRLESPHKGLDVLLEAFGQIKALTEANLLIGGDGPSSDALVKLTADMGLSDRVRFLGRVPATERFDLLAGAQVVAMPSRYETFGMVAAEAMAVGTPVVAFDIPCLRSLVTSETGILARPFEADDYANGLLAMLDDEPRRVAAGESGRRAVAELRWDVFAEQQAEVYMRAIGAKPTATVRSAPEPSSAESVPVTPDHPVEPWPDHTPPDRAALPHHDVGVELTALLARTARQLGRPPRLLVVGNFGNGNVGDEAVLAGLLPSLTAAGSVVVVSRHPGRITADHDVPAVATKSWKAVRALRAADVLAVGGGGMFGAGLPPLVAVLPVVMCFARLVLGKRLVFQAIGAYPDTPQPTLAFLRLAGLLSDAVLVRDESSMRTMSGGWLGRRVRPVLVLDPAVNVPPAPAEEAQRFLAPAGGTGRPLLISMKPTPDMAANEQMVSVLAVVADWWCDHHTSNVVVLPLSGQGDYGLGDQHSDRMLGMRMVDKTRHNTRIYIAPEGCRPALAKAVMGQSAAVLGVRLHAQIFAWSMGTPLLGLTFEPKARAWLDQTHGDQIELEGMTAETVIAWLARL